MKIINKMNSNQMNIFTGNVDESNLGEKLIAKLNHDCLSKVLMYVPIVEKLEMEKVCQKWMEACRMCWYNVKKLDFNNFVITLDKKEEIIKTIMIRCCRYLTHLKIIDKYQQYPWMCDVLKNNYCKNIIDFSINMKDFDEFPDEDLIEIIRAMSKLKYLTVELAFKDSTSNLSNQIIDLLPEDMREIHLCVAVSQWRDEFSNIDQALKKFNGLHCLTLRGFYLTHSTLESILQNKNTLVELDLSWCRFPSDKLSIFKNLENLKHLYLWEINNFNVNEIISIGRNCSKLKYFAFQNMVSDGETPEKIPYKVPYRIFCELKYLNLEHLQFYAIDISSNDGGNQIFDIANNWKQLKYLDLREGHNFSLLDLQEITKFKNLEFVNLCWAIKDSQSFINIANNCLELKELLVYFKYFPETVLEKLPNLTKLERLDLSSCDKLTGKLLSEIADNCKNLVELDLIRCFNVTEDSLIKVGKLKNLKKLNISNIVNVPNVMFYDFRKLEVLACRHCPTVNDEGIIKVLDNCQKLSRLHLEGTGITFRSLVHASKRKFVFEPLQIFTNRCVKNDYTQNTSTSSLYMIIHSYVY